MADKYVPVASTVVQGTLGIDDVNTSKQIRDVRMGLWRLYDQNNLKPIVSILGYAMQQSQDKGAGQIAKNPKIEWFMGDLLPRWDDVASGAIAGVTATITMTNLTMWKVGDLVEFPLLPYTTTTTNMGIITTYTVATGVAVLYPVGRQLDADPATGTAKTFVAIPTGTKAMLVSDNSEEYSLMPAAKHPYKTQAFNLITFKRVPYKIGNIEQEVAQYTGDQLSESREDTSIEIQTQMERDLIWSERDKWTEAHASTSTGARYAMRGMKRWIETSGGDNVLDWSDGLTEQKFDEYLEFGPCRYGSQRKYGFFGTELFLEINQWAKAKERIIGTIDILGISFMRYRAPGGREILMHNHHLFDGPYGAYGLICDPAFMKMIPYGRKGALRELTNQQENDRAGYAGEWQAIYTLHVKRVEPHGWIRK